MASQHVQSAFTAGELSPQLAARTNFDKFFLGLSREYNAISQPHGGVKKRPGFEFIGELPGPAALYEFSFSNEQSFVLCFGANWLEISSKDGFLAEEDSTDRLHMASPYTYEQAQTLSMIQYYDTIYIACENTMPRKLIRWSNTNWEFIPISFSSPIPTPGAVTAARDGTSSPAVTRYKYYVSAINKDKIESEASESNEVVGPSYTNWHVGDGITVTWPRSVGTGDAAPEKYFIYKSALGGDPLYVATVVQPETGTTVTWRDTNTQGNVSKGPVIWDNPFPNEDNTGNDFPSVVGIFEQRLVYAGSNTEPETLYFSQIGKYEDFSYGDPLSAADSFDFKLATNRVSKVYWIEDMRNLVVGSASKEWEVASTGAGFSATTATRRVSSNYGSSSKVPGISVGSLILHVTRAQNVVRDLQYQFSNDTFGGLDRNILATHLFETHSIIDWTYQQTPDSIVWCVREDGVLLGLTIMLEQNIYAWHQHHTAGKFLHVLSLPDSTRDILFCCVERDGKYYLEKQAEHYYDGDWAGAVYSDCAKKFIYVDKQTEITGLEHLEGREVCILADGGVENRQTVTDGKIILEAPANTVIVGIPFRFDIVSLPLERGSETLTRIKAINGINMRVHNTMTIKAGIDGHGEDALQINKTRTDEPMGTPPRLSSRDIIFPCSVGVGQKIAIRAISDDPTPVTILAWTIEYQAS